MKNAGFVGKDMNKIDRDETAEFGGITIIFGFVIALMVALFYHTYIDAVIKDFVGLIAGLLTITLIGFLGFVDDFLGWKKGLHQWQHFLLPVFAALPMMALNVGTDVMVLPIVGAISFGVYYSLIIVPAGITGAANATNLLAGFNGLETGMGIIIAISLIIVAGATGRTDVLIILVGLIGALIAFLYFNKYPAKIFPGDALTLMLGGTFAVVAIIGSMEKVAALLIGFYIIEFFIKLKHRFKTECFGRVQEDGSLKAREDGGSLTHFVMGAIGKNRLNEKQVVMIFYAGQIILSAIVLALYFNGLI